MFQYGRISPLIRANRIIASTRKFAQDSVRRQALCAVSQARIATTVNSPVLLQSLNGNNFYVNERGFRTSASLWDLRDVVVPALAESLSEGDIRWDKAVGDTVGEDEVIGEVETDKTSVPIHSPVAGVIEELLVESGATVQPGKVVLRIRVGAGGGSAPAKPKPAAEAAPAAESAPAAPAAPVAAPPKAETLIDSGKKLASSTVQSVQSKADAQPDLASTASGSSRKETRVKINRMRHRIAERLKDAQNTYAMLTTFNEVDMTNVMEMRNKYKEAFLKKHGIKLGFMSAFVKASSYALQDQPVVNAVIDGGEVVYRDYTDISVAVSTPKGLVVPVIRNVGSMNYFAIEKSIAELGEKARTNSLAIEDMDGGTFTISNGGVFGSMFGTPIINPPQSAILGMHAVIDRPVAIKGQVVIRPMMYICLTYDHRLIDGREAVTFLKKIKATVEDPTILLLDV